MDVTDERKEQMVLLKHDHDQHLKAILQVSCQLTIPPLQSFSCDKHVHMSAVHPAGGTV